nr:hypothetical protein [Haliscomenobacter sp.]
MLQQNEPEDFVISTRGGNQCS